MRTVERTLFLILCAAAPAHAEARIALGAHSAPSKSEHEAGGKPKLVESSAVILAVITDEDGAVVTLEANTSAPAYADVDTCTGLQRELRPGR